MQRDSGVRKRLGLILSYDYFFIKKILIRFFLVAGYSSRDYTDGVDEEEAALQEVQYSYKTTPQSFVKAMKCFQREADLELAAKVGKVKRSHDSKSYSLFP